MQLPTSDISAQMLSVFHAYNSLAWVSSLQRKVLAIIGSQVSASEQTAALPLTTGSLRQQTLQSMAFQLRE